MCTKLPRRREWRWPATLGPSTQKNARCAGASGPG